jgi:mono/diheme cytochrome c family protein
MSGGRLGFASVNILLLSILVSCGRREAPAGDTGQTPAASDSAAAGPSDTIRSANAGTAAAVTPRADSAVAAKPGAVATATPPKTTPPPRLPAKPRPAAPARPPATMEAPDTQRAAAPAETAQLPAEAGAPLRDAYHQAPLDTVSQEVYQGWKQFNLNCARCHGEDVQGTTIAPHLIVSLRPDGAVPTKELFVQTVCAGRPEKGMPAWCSLGLEMDKINAIYSYVKGRSEGKIHQGRPAVGQ